MALWVLLRCWPLAGSHPFFCVFVSPVYTWLELLSRQPLPSHIVPLAAELLLVEGPEDSHSVLVTPAASHPSVHPAPPRSSAPHLLAACLWNCLFLLASPPRLPWIWPHCGGDLGRAWTLKSFPVTFRYHKASLSNSGIQLRLCRAALTGFGTWLLLNQVDLTIFFLIKIFSYNFFFHVFPIPNSYHILLCPHTFQQSCLLDFVCVGP